jgi:macrolide-specific efflux system membrane fusion protein
MIALFNTVLLSGIVLGDPSPSNELQVEAVLTLLEEVRVPARDAGVLSKLNVRPGATVKSRMVVGELDNTKAKLHLAQARLELSNAKRLSAHDLKVQLAKKSYEVASAELKRATQAQKRFEKSVSHSELDRLRLETERTGLEIDQSQFDFETAQLAVQAKETTVRLAEHDLVERTIVTQSPGIVVEVLKKPGEWVEPGEPVVRIVRMDRLRVEGFLPAERATAKLVGQKVKLLVKLGDGQDVELDAELTFVSPEIHPVNGMVRIWAEVPNRDLMLRPGLRATMKIKP